MNESLGQLKSQVCEVGKRIWQKGFCAGNEGNHSVRVPGQGNRFLCTPTGISKGFLVPNDICLVDAEGRLVEDNPNGRRPSSEVKVHLAIYKHRPDVNAVIHSHPPHATAFAIAGVPLPEGIHPEAEVFLGRVETAHYATPSTHDLPNSILPHIGPQTNTVLMGNHGSVSFSNGLVDAYYKLEILDAYCRILLLVKQIGRVNLLDANQMTELLRVKKRFGMDDERLTCSPRGCVGEVNDAFLATFPVQPMSARCACEGGDVACACENGSGGYTPQDEPTAEAPQTSDDFEQAVQLLTDQIMASMN